MAEYRYNYTSNNRGNRGDPKNNEIASWIITILLLGAVPPLGVLMLFVKLFGGTPRRGSHPYDGNRYAQTPGARTFSASSGAGTAYGDTSASAPGRSAPSAARPAPADPWNLPQKTEYSGAVYDKKAWKLEKKLQKAQKKELESGKVMTLIGGILTGIFGFVSVVEFFDMLTWAAGYRYILRDMIPLLCFLAGGAGLLWCGMRKQKKARRYRKYLALIGKRKTISISALAQAMPASPATVRRDLEDMLDSGFFPAGYLDYGDDELVLTDQGLQDDEPAPEPEKAADPMEEKDAILAEIRAVNDAIAHPQLSAQIDRIEEITAKIFEYQKTHPEKAPQLRTFLSYYLPATLKILHAYARLESQGVEGENINAAMGRIEDMMSKVVEGFEKQLDQLFRDDAMDITTDVAVLERMLSKDGLSSGDGLQLGI